MPTVTLDCEVHDCGKQCEADNWTNVLAMMHLHQKNVHEAGSHAGNSKQKAPKVDRPKLSRGISAEEFATWQKRYELWKKATAISIPELSCQLLACCDTELESALIQYHDDIDTVDETELLKRIRKIAVLEVAATVRINEVLSTVQGHGESARAFCARLRGKAQTCSFEVVCAKEGCDQKTSYCDNIVRHQLLKGLSSPEIKREVLGTTDIDSKSLADTLSLIEAKERAVRATTNTNDTVSAVSAYKKEAKNPNSDAATPTGTTACASCGSRTAKYGRNRHGQLRELKFCPECFKAARKKNHKPRPNQHAAIEDSALFEGIDFLAGIEVRQGSSVSGNVISKSNNYFHSATGQTLPKGPSSPQGPAPDPPSPHALHVARDTVCFSGAIATGLDTQPIDNYLYDDLQGWHTGDSKPHPRISLTATTDIDAYHKVKRNPPASKPITAEWVSDTGAMSCLGHPSIATSMGIEPKHLIPVTRAIRTATHGDIRVNGAIFLRLSAAGPDAQQYKARVMLYLSPQVDNLYLSRHAQEQLRIIPESYPQVGAAAAINSTIESTPKCECPTRSLPPGQPSALPFPATEENSEKMRQWLLQRYASSTFNKCPHQPLPVMTGPPMKIRISESAVPTVTRRSPRTPAHWKADVKNQLDQDVALGVIEKVPPGTPTTWLHNMVITPKSDGSPRRTIDLQPLNKVSLREKHHVIPPAEQVRTVPKDQIMTVFDAWNGYHSIPVHEEDRDKLSFNTEYGVYRYCRAPQGFTASGDAYTHRYDTIVAAIPRLCKVVDDSLLFDPASEIEAHWWRVIDYLEVCGKHGIVLNPEPKKFQFSQRSVDFTSFRITGSDVTPLPKHLLAVRDFPTPKSITDVRSWFGLINQVAHYGRMIDIMMPFKPLLSPKTKFAWTPELDSAFNQSKELIIEAISSGLSIYDPERITCLQTDYSGKGVGYWLYQKYCSCNSRTPNCECTDGWRVTLVGSRYLRDAELRYAPIEGECLGIAWALEDTKWFTLGAKNLVVATDHKPLLKILGDKQLDNIANPRMFRLKQRTLMWSFDIVYVAGKSNLAADATSRFPSSAETDCTMESDMVASLQSNIDSSGAVTWHAIRAASAEDPNISALADLVSAGFPEGKASLPTPIRPYWQHRDHLSVIDGVVMLGKRIIIPKSLRGQVLTALHSAHQGTSGMQSRAQDCVFWLGITADIQQARNSCPTCASIAPSQPRMPPIDPIIPQYPFQAVVLDYFCVKGVKYLIAVDRFSGWPHLARAKYSHEAAGARGLCRTLRVIFATFGVPEEATSDGGPEFTADETEAFLKRWDVTHRLSAPYNSEGNGRAEVGVKSMKRLLSDNTRDDGSLDSDEVLAGLLQYRNTPDPTTGVSPAMILFGRQLRDAIPIPPGTSLFSNPAVSPVWRSTWSARENALGIRYAKQVEKLQANSRDLGTLNSRDQVRIQNLCGAHPTKWDRTGQVLEQLPHDQYLVKMSGSGRILRRNRRHLRRVVALHPPRQIPMPPNAPESLPDPPQSPNVSTPSNLPPSPSPTLAEEPSVEDTPTPTPDHITKPPTALNISENPPNSLSSPSATIPSDLTGPPPSPGPATLPGEPLVKNNFVENVTGSLAEPSTPCRARPRRTNAGLMPVKYQDFEVEIPNLK